MKFDSYNLKTYILEALKNINFEKPTKIQTLVIPKAIKGDNLVVESATGSGKTHAFLIPVFERLKEEEKNVQAILIAPTRELATQLYENTLQIAKFHPDIDVRLYIGGGNRENEIKRLSLSQPHIAVGTIGRFFDLAIKSNALKIYSAKMVVIDEADMVFEEKEIIDVDKVIGVIQEKPQFLVFSATMPKGLRNFVTKYLNGAEEIIIEEKALTKTSIEHIMIPCKAKQKTFCITKFFYRKTFFVI